VFKLFSIIPVLFILGCQAKNDPAKELQECLQLKLNSKYKFCGGTVEQECKEKIKRDHYDQFKRDCQKYIQSQKS